MKFPRSIDRGLIEASGCRIDNPAALYFRDQLIAASLKQQRIRRRYMERLHFRDQLIAASLQHVAHSGCR